MAGVSTELACKHGCGWCAYGRHTTCCTSCKGPHGPHARDCAMKNRRCRPAAGSTRVGQSAASHFDAVGVMSYTHVLADGTAGTPAPVDIVVHDGRPALEAGRIKLAEQGFTLARCPTKLATKEFYTPETITSRYYREQEDLIKRMTGASKVIVLNNIVRNAGRADDRGSSNPFAGGGNGINGYANVVHTDFRARRSVQKFYEQPDSHDMTMPAKGGVPHGKWMLLNTWRNISDSNPIYNNTLACCDQQTVSSPDDFVSVDVPLSAQAHAEQYRLASHTKDKHSWYYFPRMTKDEVLIFTQFDSDPQARARFCFHTAFNDPTVDPTLPQRESIECRVIAFFPSPGKLRGGGLARYVQEVHPGDVGDLLKQLAQGAAHGLLQPGELEALVDKAAYDGAQNEDFIRTLCAERRIPYQPGQWEAGPEADGILEELDALTTYARAKSLKGPSPEEKRAIDPNRMREDVNHLRTLFPQVEADIVVAVYHGFGGNFDTTLEMLSLAANE